MNISKDKLSIYDKMVRDEIQIKAERDYAVEVAVEKAEAKGESKKQVEIAKAMKSKGIDVTIIAECTGLAEEQIRQL